MLSLSMSSFHHYHCQRSFKVDVIVTSMSSSLLWCQYRCFDIIDVVITLTSSSSVWCHWCCCHCFNVVITFISTSSMSLRQYQFKVVNVAVTSTSLMRSSHWCCCLFVVTWTSLLLLLHSHHCFPFFGAFCCVVFNVFYFIIDNFKRSEMSQ